MYTKYGEDDNMQHNTNTKCQCYIAIEIQDDELSRQYNPSVLIIRKT